MNDRAAPAPYAVTRTFTAEWQQTWEIVAERSQHQQAALGLPGIAGMTLEMLAERAIRTAYSITETTRVTRSDEVSFEVPPGVRRDVRVAQRRVWHPGAVRVDRPEGSIDIPFRVLTEVEIGYDFDDGAQTRRVAQHDELTRVRSSPDGVVVSFDRMRWRLAVHPLGGRRSVRLSEAGSAA